MVNCLSTETDVEQNYKLANELDDAAAPEGLPQAWKKLEGNELEVHVAQEYSGGFSDEETKDESQNTSSAPTASSRSPEIVDHQLESEAEPDYPKFPGR